MMKNNNDFAIEKSGNVIQQMSQSKPRDEDDMSIAQEEPTKRISKGKMHLKHESIKDELENTELEDEGPINQFSPLNCSSLISQTTIVHDKYRHLAVQLNIKFFHDPYTLLDDAVKILQEMKLLTNENKDSKMFKYANSILLKHLGSSSKKNVCCLLGCESEYINPYQNIIGQIQSDKRPIKNHPYIEYSKSLELTLWVQKFQLDGLRQPKQLQELIDNFTMYWKSEEKESLKCKHFSCDEKHTEAIASLYKKLFVELVKILIFSQIINYHNIHPNFFFEGFFGNTNNYCRCTSEYEYAEEIKKFINDSGVVEEEFYTWIDNHNKKFSDRRYFHPLHDKKIKYLNNKIEVFNIKVRQSIDFFKDPKDIWTAIITVYYSASQNLYKNSRGSIHLEEPKKYTSEQIEEQGVLMRENCESYFLKKNKKKLKAFQNQLFAISGYSFYKDSSNIKTEFKGFPFFSSERQEQFIKNLE